MIVETLQWFTPAEKLPDDDATVLLKYGDDVESEPVWPGWLCDGEWFSGDGMPVGEPLLWAQMPIGEAAT